MVYGSVALGIFRYATQILPQKSIVTRMVLYLRDKKRVEKHKFFKIYIIEKTARGPTV